MMYDSDISLVIRENSCGVLFVKFADGEFTTETVMSDQTRDFIRGCAFSKTISNVNIYADSAQALYMYKKR